MNPNAPPMLWPSQLAAIQQQLAQLDPVNVGVNSPAREAERNHRAARESHFRSQSAEHAAEYMLIERLERLWTAIKELIKTSFQPRIPNVAVVIDGGDPLPAANDNEAFRTAKTKLGTADEAVRRFVKDMSSPVSGVSILHKLRHGGASDPELGKRMRTLVAIYDMIMAGLLEGETSITEMVEATVLSEYVYGMIIDGFGGEPGWCDERLFVNWLKGVTNA